MLVSARYAISALVLNITLQQGEHDMVDASLCSSTTAGAGSTEGEKTATADATDPPSP